VVMEGRSRVAPQRLQENSKDAAAPYQRRVASRAL